MITLHIAKWLEQEGFGTLDTDIFWEEIAVDSQGKPKDGVWVVTRAPDDITRLNATTQNFDIYSRYANKITGSQKLENILKRLQEAYGDVCILPTVPPHSLIEYYDVMITPTSGIDNVGTDDQGKVVRVISGNVKFKKKES